MSRRQFVQQSGLVLLPAAGLLGGVPRGLLAATPVAAGPLAARLRHDRLRPQIHLLPAANWMNDPCAPRFHAGKYHVFFQYNPGASVWGDMHWAHATSLDMLHWQHQPVALSPVAGTADAAGCFTGSVLPGVAEPSIVFTAVTRVPHAEETIPNGGLREVQCLAVAQDKELRTWTKLPQPILATPPAGLEVVGFRDPVVWLQGTRWYMGVGSGFRRKGGAVLLYTSTDARQWHYLHPLAEGEWTGTPASDPVDSGEMWECPDFFSLDGRWVLLYSTMRKVFWQVGDLEPATLRFHATAHGMLDHGAYYAPKSMVDAQSRRVLWGWIPEKRPEPIYRAAGWAGMMSLPRLLRVTSSGRLSMQPIPELRALEQTRGSVLLAAAGDHGTMILPDRLGRLTLAWQPAAGVLRLQLSAGTGTAAVLTCVSERSADGFTLSLGERRLALHPDSAGRSTLDLWCDGSVAELFVDSAEVLTERLYAAPAAPLLLSWTIDAAARPNVTHAMLLPISRDRLTS